MEEMIASRFRSKKFVPIPEASQLDTLSAATKLLNNRQQLLELDEALQAKKEVRQLSPLGVVPMLHFL